MVDKQIVFSPPLVAPASVPLKPAAKPVLAAGMPAFGQVLNQEIAGVKFSQHAQERLLTRNISLGRSELSKLSSALDKAAAKGARESLVLMDNLALVVSVKNRTVITAVDSASLKNNVFTNIDSAVIV
ncbi:MAG: TIGR02530 family flagellar biosynthesis protein [Sporomusaceae bacterium]|nr:TIGR02530 family flagellar biosynthesis protein [Sporomusaceae bacterium]